MPRTKWLKEHMFIMVLEAGRSKLKVLADLVSDEDTLLGLLLAIFSLYPHMVENRED